MTNAIVSYLRRHALAAAAFTCSILALAGSSYAAFTISGAQIENHTINPVKLNPKFTNGTVRAWAIVSPNGKVIAGAGGPRVTAQVSDPGGFGVAWAVKVGRCETTATIDEASSSPTERLSVAGNPSVPFTAGYAVASTNRPRSRSNNATFVQTYNQQGQPTPLGVDLAVIC